MSCASPLTSPASGPTTVYPAPPASPLTPHQRHRQPHEELVGLLGLAFVLVAVSAVFAWNSSLPTELQQWSRIVSAHNTVFVRPPEGVIVSAAWFFAIVGLFEIVAAGLRWALRWTYLRVAGRFLSAAGDLVFAVLLFLYSAHTISGLMLGAVLAGAVGMLLVMFVMLGLYWATARPMPRPASVQPPTQQ